MRHRHRLSVLLLAVTLVASLAFPALAAPGQPAPAASNFPAAGIKVDRQVIRPGEALPVIFGVVGPPDQVRAMRSKKEADDYVLFTYFTYGFSLHIVNDRVQGILVESPEVVVEGVPFRVGDNKASVLKAWGDPDRTQSTSLAYWRRGVYVGHDASGIVTNLFLTAPGRIEQPDRAPGPVGG